MEDETSYFAYSNSRKEMQISPFPPFFLSSLDREWSRSDKQSQNDVKSILQRSIIFLLRLLAVLFQNINVNSDDSASAIQSANFAAFVDTLYQ